MNYLNTDDQILREYVKRFFIILMIVFVVVSLASCASHKAIPAAADPLANFKLLVEKDKGLSPGEKGQWISLAQQKFQDKHFSFDYSRLLYGILSQAKFDEVNMEKAIQVAFLSAKAVNRGGPEEEVSDLALFAFSVSLTADEIRLYAVTSKKCKTAGVPAHVAQEMIRHSKEDRWTEHAFTTIMNGLTEAARQDLEAEKVALFMLISVDQKLGTPEQIVQDAIKDAKKRKSVILRKEQVKPAVKPPNLTPSIKTSKVALNYDAFRNSIESFIGTSYVWGGNTRRGVDCSGFTKLVMYENGYLIPRVSRDQAKKGAPVYKNQLQLGDLVFFDTKGQGYITHVGFYLGGNLMVHASSSKGVTIVLFSNRYFQSRYVTARRVVRYQNR